MPSAAGTKKEAPQGLGWLTTRPLVCLTLFFLLGIAAALAVPGRLSPISWSLVAAAGLTLAAATMLLWRKGLQPTLVWCALFFLLGLLNALSCLPELPYPPRLAPFIDRADTLYIGRIVGAADYYPHKTRFGFEIEAAAIDGRAIPVNSGILLTVRQVKRRWLNGTRLMTRLTLRRFHNFGTPGTFDYARSQALEGLYARAHLADDRFMVRIANDPAATIGRPFRWMSARIDAHRQDYRLWMKKGLSRQNFSLGEALLLGYRHELAPALKESIRRAGVSHLLAISGLHLGFVALSLFFIVQGCLRLLFPWLLHHLPDRHPAWMIAVLGSVSYALMSGLTVPTWRAAVMVVLAAGALFSYRKADPPTLLAAAALAILANRPDLLHSVSFQMSFGALIGILLFWPRVSRAWTRFSRFRPDWPAPILSRLFRPCSDAFLISICVNLIVLPLAAYHFQGVSLAGFMANIVLVPFVGLLIIPCGLAALFLHALHLPAATLALSLTGREIETALALIRWLAGRSWSYQWVGEIPLAALIGYYSVIAVWQIPFSRQRKAVLLTALAIVATGWHLVSTANRQETGRNILEVDFIDVGQGSSALVRFPQGSTMLVDGGGFFDQSFDVGRHVVAPFLWHKGIHHLDRVVLTHDHPDHRNGLLFVLHAFPVGEYWETGFTCDQSGVSLPARIAHHRHIPVRSLASLPPSSAIDGCRVRIRYPPRTATGRRLPCNQLNRESLVLEIRFGNTRLILPGDIDVDGERKAFRDPPQGGSVLLFAPHHGSATSCGSGLLDTLRPTAVVISCGFQNGFGLPSAQVLARLRRRHIPVYRTDLNGTVTARSNGLRWKLHCYSDAFAQY